MYLWVQTLNLKKPLKCLQNSLGESVLFITPANGVINLTGYVLEERKKEKVDKSESSDDTREIQTPDSPEIVKKRRPRSKSKIACLFSCGLKNRSQGWF